MPALLRSNCKVENLPFVLVLHWFLNNVIIKVLRISNHFKELCLIKYKQIWKKLYPPETNTCSRVNYK